MLHKTRGMLTRALTLAAVLLTACLLPSSADAESTYERIVREGTIRVGIYNEVPVGYIDENGRVTGETPEVLRVALAGIGDIEMEPFVVDEFGALIPGLLAGRFDVIAAGLYITQERCETIAYTRPTIKYGETLVVREGNAFEIHSYDDVAQHPEAVIAVAPGSVEAKYARAAGIPDDRIRMLAVSQIGVAALRSGQVDVLAVPAVTGQKMVESAVDGDIELVDPFIDPVFEGKVAINYAGMGLRQEDTDLLTALNAQLDEFLDTVGHLELVSEFGFAEAQLPDGKTAEEVCSGN